MGARRMADRRLDARLMGVALVMLALAGCGGNDGTSANHARRLPFARQRNTVQHASGGRPGPFPGPFLGQAAN